MQGDDADRNREQQTSIVMHCDSAKSDHPLERLGKLGPDPVATGQQVKNLPCALWHTQVLPADQILPHIQCRLTRTLHVQHRSVLAGEVGGESGWVGLVFFARTGNTTLDGRCLVDKYIVNHGLCP